MKFVDFFRKNFLFDLLKKYGSDFTVLTVTKFLCSSTKWQTIFVLNFWDNYDIRHPKVKYQIVVLCALTKYSFNLPRGLCAKDRVY